MTTDFYHAGQKIIILHIYCSAATGHNTMRFHWTEEDEGVYTELLVDEAFKGNIDYRKDNEDALNRILPLIMFRRGKLFTVRELRRKFYSLLKRCSLWEKATKHYTVRWNHTTNMLESPDEEWERLLQWAERYRHEGERYWLEFSIIFANRLPVDDLAVLPNQRPPLRWGDSVERSEAKEETAGPSEVKEETAGEERDKKKRRI
ncbi:hypothetical protein ACJIZ3_006032 [Penstemon smallii]|uniref:Myb/SANT-like domain-containing protein n=1 Tax=Penstemon smallii TaxID=265156 RepID=A0ABD3S6M8_9LAMI